MRIRTILIAALALGGLVILLSHGISVRMLEDEEEEGEVRVGGFEPSDLSIAAAAELPKVIEAFAAQESAEWAQEEVREDARRKYVELKDWEGVGIYLTAKYGSTDDNAIL